MHKKGLVYWWETTSNLKFKWGNMETVGKVGAKRIGQMRRSRLDLKTFTVVLYVRYYIVVRIIENGVVVSWFYR